MEGKTEKSGRKRQHRGRGSGWGPALGVLAALSLALPGCGDILSTDAVSDPNEIGSDATFTLQQTLVGATASFVQAYDVKIVFSGLLGDEFVNSGTTPEIQEWDRRDLTPDCCAEVARAPLSRSPNFIPMQQASKVNDLAQQRMLNGEFAELEDPADSPELALVSTFEGFAKVGLADLFCTTAFDGTGPELTSKDVYALAETEFSRALGASGVDAEVRQAALVGRARVRLILGDEEGALQDAQQVDPDFEFLAEYSSNSFEQQNMINFRTWQFGNWSVDPTFRNLSIDDTNEPDPRVDLVLNPRPAFEPSQPLWAPVKASSESSPIVVASGDEAQYIIAEIQGGQEAVDIINQVRARNGITETWQPSTGDPTEIRDKLIDERRRTLFLEGVRLGDLRRYIEKFGLDFFPTTTPQGFPVGDQTCAPLPEVERDNNPDI